MFVCSALGVPIQWRHWFWYHPCWFMWHYLKRDPKTQMPMSGGVAQTRPSLSLLRYQGLWLTCSLFFDFNLDTRGMMAVVIVFILIGVIHIPDGPFIRPHPGENFDHLPLGFLWYCANAAFPFSCMAFSSLCDDCLHLASHLHTLSSTLIARCHCNEKNSNHTLFSLGRCIIFPVGWNERGNFPIHSFLCYKLCFVLVLLSHYYSTFCLLPPCAIWWNQNKFMECDTNVMMVCFCMRLFSGA